VGAKHQLWCGESSAKALRLTMMTPAKVPLALTCLLLARVPNLPAQDLVFNGTFGNISNTFVADGNTCMSLQPGATTIPGWTTTNAELVWASNSNRFNLTSPFGPFLLDLTGYHDSYPYAGVTQVLPTVAGQTYQVSFALGQDQQDSRYSGPVSVTAMAGAASNGTYTFTPTNSSGNHWSTFQADFTAQADSTMITITGQAAQGGTYLGLDNVSLTAQGGGPELLVNGGLEDINDAFVVQEEGAMSLALGSTDIAGWVVTGAEIAWITNSNPLGLSTPYGSMFIDLTGFHDSVPYGGIQQTVTTSPGQNYTLSFSLGVDQSNPGYSGPVSVQASLLSGMVATTTTSGGNWQTFGFTLLANSVATPLTIIGASTAGGQFIGLGKVSATSGTPALRITSVQPALGTNLVLSFNSQVGNAYAVQSTLDISSGLWTPLAGTTNAGTGGSVTVTLTNALTGGAGFYRIQQLQ
jgi:hypothetical protein